MNRICRSSSRRRSLSSGAMTTNFARSKAMCRSISGKVPLPMEPKPIITIGPSKRAWSGPLSVEGMGAFTSVTPEQEGSRRVRRETIVAAGETRNQGGKIGPTRERTAGADQPAGAVERARLELVPKQPVALIRPGQPQRAGLLAGEPEPRIIGGVADQQHGAMTATFGLAQRVVHQRRADATLAAVGRDRERAQQQRRPIGTRRYLPQPHRTDDAAALGGHPRPFP